VAGLGATAGATKLALTCGAVAATVACVGAVGPDLVDRKDEQPQRTGERRSTDVGQASSASAAGPELLPSQIGNEGSVAPPATTAAQPADDPGQESDAEAPKPVPAQEEPSADFSFGGEEAGTTTSAARSTVEPTSSSSPSSGGTGGGGGDSSAGGDFSFGG
jgi:hypothetical protein